MTPRKWKSEPIAPDDPFARFAEIAQRVFVRRVIAANRNHCRKRDARNAQKRDARESRKRFSAPREGARETLMAATKSQSLTPSQGQL